MIALTLVAASALALEFPSIDQPHRSGASAPADAALIISVETYYELPDVPFAQADAQAFRDFLVYTRGLAPDRVEVLAESRSTSASLIRKAAKRLGERVSDGGTAWVFFAGHGAASPTTSERLLMGG